MRRIITFALFLSVFLTQAQAQYREDVSDSMVYVSNVDKLLFEEVKFAFKLIPLGVEQKIGKNFSLNVMPKLNATAVANDSLPSGGEVEIRFTLDWELRYYHKMANRINSGLQANNITGRYFAFGTSTVFGGATGLNSKFRRFSTRYGYQRKISKREFLDVGLNLQYTRNPYLDDLGVERNLNIVSISNYTRYGFLFIKKDRSLNNDRNNVISYFTNRKSAWRVNLNRLVRLINVRGVVGVDNFFVFAIRPNISYERKIADSVFSLDQELSSTISIGTRVSQGAPLELFESSIRYRIGGKYFYRMKKKQLQGRSGNNLSGAYLFWRASHTQKPDKTDGFSEFGIGLQRDLDRVFVDLNLYGRIRTYGSKYSDSLLEAPISGEIRVSYIIK